MLDGRHGQPAQPVLFLDDREAPEPACETIHLRLYDLSRPRQWGSCWLACSLWDQLRLDQFWTKKLTSSRKGTNWFNVLKALVHIGLSDGLVDKQRAMRKRRLKKLWRRFHELHKQNITRYNLLLKIGTGKKEAGRAYSLVKLNLPKANEAVNSDTFTFHLPKKKLREVPHREGCYLFRSNLTAGDPAMLWQYYIQLTEFEQAFKELKSDLSIRPIHHQTDERIEAHIFVAFMAYCLQVMLKHQTKQLAPGLTPRSILE